MQLLGSMFPDEDDIIQATKMDSDIASDIHVLVNLGRMVIGLTKSQYETLLIELREVEDARA